MKELKPISKQEIEESFRYNAKRNVLKRKWKNGKWKKVNIDKSNSGVGFVRIKFKGRTIGACELIYMLVIGDIPANMKVTHTDSDRTNNNISNLKLLSHEDSRAKNSCGLRPHLDKRRGSFFVQEMVKFGKDRHYFYFKRFKIKSEADKFCKTYNDQFGYGKPQRSARKGTPEQWKSCMKAFRDSYFK